MCACSSPTHTDRHTRSKFSGVLVQNNLRKKKESSPEESPVAGASGDYSSRRPAIPFALFLRRTVFSITPHPLKLSAAAAPCVFQRACKRQFGGKLTTRPRPDLVRWKKLDRKRPIDLKRTPLPGTAPPTHTLFIQPQRSSRARANDGHTQKKREYMFSYGIYKLLRIGKGGERKKKRRTMAD